MNDVDQDQILCLAEAAKLLGMKTRELKNLAEKGKIPGSCIGGVWTCHRNAILKWKKGSK
jgi:hypothetical protein